MTKNFSSNCHGGKIVVKIKTRMKIESNSHVEASFNSLPGTIDVDDPDHTGRHRMHNALKWPHL